MSDPSHHCADCVPPRWRGDRDGQERDHDPNERQVARVDLAAHPRMGHTAATEIRGHPRGQIAERQRNEEGTGGDEHPEEPQPGGHHDPWL
jgi:hypothetical protein